VHEVIFHAERILVHIFGGSGPPSNTRYLRSTRVVIPNGISIGSAVFVWVPNSMLYNAVSLGSKPQNYPFPLRFRHPAGGGPSHGHRQHAQKNWKRSRVWFWRYPRGQTDRQTDKQTCSSQYFATAPAGEVIIIIITCRVPIMLLWCGKITQH